MLLIGIPAKKLKIIKNSISKISCDTKRLIQNVCKFMKQGIVFYERMLACLPGFFPEYIALDGAREVTEGQW